MALWVEVTVRISSFHHDPAEVGRCPDDSSLYPSDKPGAGPACQARPFSFDKGESVQALDDTQGLGENLPVAIPDPGAAMGPHTLETLKAELENLTKQVEAANEPSGLNLSGTRRAVIHFRIQMLQAMLDEMQSDERGTTRH